MGDLPLDSPKCVEAHFVRAADGGNNSPQVGDKAGDVQFSEDSLRILFDNAADAMVICGTNGRILRVNAATEQLFGYQRHELAGKSIEQLVPERLRTLHRQHLQIYIERPQSRVMSTSPEIWGLRKDGSEIPLEISLNPVESLHGLVLFVIVRDRSEWFAARKYRWEAEFERILAEQSAKFINLSPEKVDAEIRAGLQSVGAALKADRVTVALKQSDSGDLAATHAWTAEGIPEFPKLLLKELLPWLVERALNGEATFLRPKDLPPEAQREREYMESIGAKRSVLIPFRVGGDVIGGIAADAFREEQPWDENTMARFQGVAEIFANALSRKREEEKLRRAYAEIQNLRERLENENRYLREEIKLEYRHSAIVGDSPAIREVLRKAEQVAPTDSIVLILGETGTGKELIARRIHEMSKRSKHPLIKANCAAFPPTLIESELFGREKGAYTGALAREIGRFELADKSTIFLDEIGDFPLEVQAKLLRILQEGQFERLGSSRTIHVDFRIIAATNRDLQAMVKEGKFREDLYYRLNVFPIVAPPLRDRAEDIPALVWHILKELGQRMGRNVEEVQARTMTALQHYSWPGNVRELRNVIERNLILNSGPVFHVEGQEFDRKPIPGMRHFEEVESEYFQTILQATKWRIRGHGGAADVLGLKPTTLEAKLKKLNIQRPT